MPKKKVKEFSYKRLPLKLYIILYLTLFSLAVAAISLVFINKEGTKESETNFPNPISVDGCKLKNYVNQADDYKKGEVSVQDLGDGSAVVIDSNLQVKFEIPCDWYYTSAGLTSYDPHEDSPGGGPKARRLEGGTFRVAMSWVPENYVFLPIILGENPTSNIKYKVLKREELYLTSSSSNSTGPIIYLEVESPLEWGEPPAEYYIPYKDRYFAFSMRPYNTAHKDKIEEVLTTLEFLD